MDRNLERVKRTAGQLVAAEEAFREAVLMAHADGRGLRTIEAAARSNELVGNRRRFGRETLRAIVTGKGKR